MKLIGLTGPAGSGKSTVAKHLVEYENFRLVKFAGPLKAMTRTLFEEMGADSENRWRFIEGDLKELRLGWLGGHSPRHAMQTLGTEWGRKCMGEDFWVNVAKNRIVSEFEADPTACLVFDDVRFENEAAMIRKMGGHIVHIAGRGGLAGSHESESGVEPHADDFCLINDRDKNYLTTMVTTLVEITNDI